MNVRFHLNETAVITTNEEMVYGEQRSVQRYSGIKLDSDNNGHYYISSNHSIFDPNFETPPINPAHILYVSVRDSYLQGFRKEGVYTCHKGKALITTRRGNNGPDQTISIKADDLDSARRIYSMIRRGELKPTEDWSRTLLEIADEKVAKEVEDTGEEYP